MNKELQAQIHRFAEDREIDYVSAKVLGEQYGLEFKSESDLAIWKQVIDRYLKTFDESAFEDIEKYIAG